MLISTSLSASSLVLIDLSNQKSLWLCCCQQSIQTLSDVLLYVRQKNNKFLNEIITTGDMFWQQGPCSSVCELISVVGLQYCFLTAGSSSLMCVPFHKSFLIMLVAVDHHSCYGIFWSLCGMPLFLMSLKEEPILVLFVSMTELLSHSFLLSFIQVSIIKVGTSKLKGGHGRWEGDCWWLQPQRNQDTSTYSCWRGTHCKPFIYWTQPRWHMKHELRVQNMQGTKKRCMIWWEQSVNERFELNHSWQTQNIA